MAFMSVTGTISTILSRGTSTITGDEFLTFFFIMATIILIGYMFRIEKIILAFIITPMFMVVAQKYAGFLGFLFVILLIIIIWIVNSLWFN